MEALSLFSADSLWTMAHGIVLGGGTLLAMAAALFALSGPGSEDPNGILTSADAYRAHQVAFLLVGVAALAWLTVIGGTYIVFPPYRMPPPEGAVDLTAYPRALLLANAETAWLHRYAMETKEHVPWIAAMLSTTAAFLAVRNRPRILARGPTRRVVAALAATVFVLVVYVALLGVFVNKVAPLH